MTASDFRLVVQQQAEEVGCECTLVLEPARRDTAAAIAAGALIAKQREANAVVLALPANYVVLDADAFRSVCSQALKAARSGYIVAFGMSPTGASTGYGYISPGPRTDIGGVRFVRSFVEKSDAAAAARYVADGYFWCTGHFAFRIDALEAELMLHDYAIFEAASAAVRDARREHGIIRLGAIAYRRAPRHSLGLAVMEKTQRAAMVEARFQTSQIGDWDTIFQIGCDASRNAIRGDVVALDVENSLIHSDNRLTAVVGVKDLVVVATSDAVLVMPRERAQDVRDLVEDLKRARRTEASDHRRAYRPWGHYDSIHVGDRFQVKHIVVAPHGKLSLQKHLHRAEHWVVVRGTAEVTIADETKTVYENQSLYVPMGAVHRLANPGKIPLELIEVQTGSYLGDDDILRLEDIYRRVA
jgi:mannose-1-phosphate guanylyltransferase/mannose-6-phosphate isomerase